ncbi:MAG: MOSC domain-containing protein [Candidatus Korarchaeota archaeon]
MHGKVVALCISEEKGVPKHSVEEIILETNYGIVGDAHAGTERQVSLLEEENIMELRKEGYLIQYGDMAENIVTTGIKLDSLPIGTTLRVGNAELKIIQKGKVCHVGCQVYKRIGKCLMRQKGIFAHVVKGGKVKLGDTVEVISPQSIH